MSFAAFSRFKTKLIGVVILFMVPIALLATIFVQTSFKDINFARKEADGTVYLTAIWPVYTNFVRASTDQSVSRKPASGVDEVATKYDEDMGTKEASKAMMTSFQKLNWPNKALVRDANTEEAIAAIKNLITKVGDGSNLILDPDLDSYYVMDVINVKLPDLVNEIGNIMAAAEAQFIKKGLNDEEKAEIINLIGRYSGIVDGVAASVQTAIKSNAPGSVRLALARPYTDFEKVAIEFKASASAMAETLRTDKRDMAPLNKLRDLSAKLVQATDTFWMASSVEMMNLLNIRISGFMQKLVWALIICGLATLAALGVAIPLVRSIVKGMNDLSRSVHKIADESMDTKVPLSEAKSEIGDVARAVAHLRDRMIERMSEANSEERASAIRASQRKAMESMAAILKNTIADVADGVQMTAANMQSSTATVANNAEITNSSVTSAVGGLTGARMTVEGIAAAVAELSASIEAISEQASHAAKIADTATNNTKDATTKADILATKVQKISEFATLIAQIAGQTNLLALNATIEAARAGEAGRGFAVVASEVKSLASQTAQATSEIDRQITEIQAAAADVVGHIEGIRNTIGDMNMVSTVIASTVEQQSQATKEITENLHQAVSQTESALDKVGQLPAITSENGRIAVELKQLSHNLLLDSENLKGSVEKFLHELAAA